MSISYVGSASTQIFNATPTDVDMPAGAGPGDLALLFFFTVSVETAGTPSTTTLSSGWTQVGSTTLSETNSTSAIESRLYWKILTSADINGTQVTTDSAAGTGHPTVLVNVYGGTTTTPISDNAVDSKHVATPSASVTSTTVTVPTGGALVQFMDTRVSGNTGTWTVPTGLTARGTAADFNSVCNAVSADDLTGATSGGGVYTAPVAAPRYAAWSVALSAAAPKHIVVRRATDGSWQ